MINKSLLDEYEFVKSFILEFIVNVVARVTIIEVERSAILARETAFDFILYNIPEIERKFFDL